MQKKKQGQNIDLTFSIFLNHFSEFCYGGKKKIFKVVFASLKSFHYSFLSFLAFSKNGQPTLRALRPLNGKTPYKALSALDAEQTNKMYGCAAKKRKRRQAGKYIIVFFPLFATSDLRKGKQKHISSLGLFYDY